MKYQEQLGFSLAARGARNRIEDEARARVVSIIENFTTGSISYRDARSQVNDLVRASYLATQSVATSTLVEQAEIPNWSPKIDTDTTYLKNLSSDARLALQQLRDSDQSDKERRRAIMRISHSVGVAAQRGYTDALVTGGKELVAEGVSVKKMWYANFVNHVPCPDCRELHGTTVNVSQEFPKKGRTKVYRDLMGPPRHPRCRCTLILFIVTLDNALDPLPVEPVEAPEESTDTMTTDDVQGMGWSLFGALIAILKKILKSLLGGV